MRIAVCSLSSYARAAHQQRKGEMNLSLGFPAEVSLETVVTQFQTAHRDPESSVRAIHHQPPSEGVYADLPGIDDRLRKALDRRGISRLYSHQAEAFAQLGAGKNVVIV